MSIQNLLIKNDASAAAERRCVVHTTVTHSAPLVCLRPVADVTKQMLHFPSKGVGLTPKADWWVDETPDMFKRTGTPRLSITAALITLWSCSAARLSARTHGNFELSHLEVWVFLFLPVSRQQSLIQEVCLLLLGSYFHSVGDRLCPFCDYTVRTAVNRIVLLSIATTRLAPCLLRTCCSKIHCVMHYCSFSYWALH